MYHKKLWMPDVDIIVTETEENHYHHLYKKEFKIRVYNNQWNDNETCTETSFGYVNFTEIITAPA